MNTFLLHALSIISLVGLTIIFTTALIRPKMRNCTYGHDWCAWKDSSHVVVAKGRAYIDQSRQCYRCGKNNFRYYNKRDNVVLYND